MKTNSFLACLSSAAFVTASASAAIILDTDPDTTGNQVGSYYQEIALGGNTRSEGWNNLRNSVVSGAGSHPGNAAWTSNIASQTGANLGGSSIVKISNGTGGGPYVGSSSLYFGGFSSVENNYGGTVGVSTTGAGLLPGVQTLVFQVDIGAPWGYDFHDLVAPTLSYTTSEGTVDGVTASFLSLYSQVQNGTFMTPDGEQPVYINSYALQFDLSGVEDPITDFTILINGVQHAQIYGMGLQQSDQAYNVSVLPVPEPSTALLGAIGALALLRRRR
jgi:hypothetical protein